MNLPNKLTVLRILLIPVFIVFASFSQFRFAYLLAMLVFSFASFTDYLDGHIARKRGLVTDFGKFADPLADKILTTTAFLYMMMDGACHPIVMVVIITREFAVSGVRMVAAGAPGGKVIAANNWGKAKTVLQMVSIIIYYVITGVGYAVPWDRLVLAGQQVSWWLCWLVAALTAISGIQYIWANKAYIDTAK